MRRTVTALACALAFATLGAGVAIAQDMYVGTVTRIDQPTSVIVLSDGRMFQVVPTTTIMVDNRPVTVTTLRPGSSVMIRGAHPVVYQDGRYLVLSPAPAAVVAAPAPVIVSPAPVVVPPGPTTTTTVTTVTTTPQIVTSASGVIANVDPYAKRVTLTDGRIVEVTSKTGIWVDGQVSTFEQLRAGMPVTLSAVNPVVSRDGRSAVFNPGFYDPGNGSSMTWDSKYAGYEADSANASMQPQGGG